MSQRTIFIIGSNGDTCGRPRAFEQVRIGNELRHLGSVDEALDYLSEAQAARESLALPALVLVSSTVASNEISKLISWLRGDMGHEPIPVVVLNSATSYVEMPMESANNSYFVRNNDTGALLDIISKYLPKSDPGLCSSGGTAAARIVASPQGGNQAR